MTWPAVVTERLDWRDSWRTYEAAIVPPISGRDIADLIEAPTAAQVGAAQQAIAAFDAEMTEEFGTLELGTIDTVLLRSEASSSSQIEHLTASAKQLALAEIGASKSVNARLVQANVAALEGASALRVFDTATVVGLQRELWEAPGCASGSATSRFGSAHRAPARWGPRSCPLTTAASRRTWTTCGRSSGNPRLCPSRTSRWRMPSSRRSTPSSTATAAWDARSSTPTCDSNA